MKASGKYVSSVAELDSELQTFDSNKEGLISSSLGKFALISGSEVLGVWDTYVDALKAGYDKCGIDKAFMVRKVRNTEQVHLIYRGTSQQC